MASSTLARFVEDSPSPQGIVPAGHRLVTSLVPPLVGVASLVRCSRTSALPFSEVTIFASPPPIRSDDLESRFLIATKKKKRKSVSEPPGPHGLRRAPASHSAESVDLDQAHAMGSSGPWSHRVALVVFFLVLRYHFRNLREISRRTAKMEPVKTRGTSPPPAGRRMLKGADRGQTPAEPSRRRRRQPPLRGARCPSSCCLGHTTSPLLSSS